MASRTAEADVEQLWLREEGACLTHCILSLRRRLSQRPTLLRSQRASPKLTDNHMLVIKSTPTLRDPRRPQEEIDALLKKRVSCQP